MNRFEDDHEAIRAVVRDYFEGVSQGKTEPLVRCWAAAVGHWKGVEIDEKGLQTVKVEPIFDSIERWAKGPKKEASGEILSIEVIDVQMAVVKFDFKLGDDHYLDVLSLYKLNGEWKLINKMFVRR